MKVLPGWAAVGLALLGGIGSAVQALFNAEVGTRVGSPAVGAVVNNVGGCLLLAVGLLAMPSMRAGLGTLRRARVPWWSYLGGVGGGLFIVATTYAVPVLGVAIFTIAQVAGNSVGGIAVDRTGLGPAGRFAVTGPRVVGTLLAIGAVSLAQLGRPTGELAVGSLLLGVAGGAALAWQAALNGKLAAIGSARAATAVNFAVSTVVVVAVAGAVGALAGLGSADWPGQWYLYLGGPLGVGIVAVILLGVQSVGVLRTGLAIVAGQLGGAVLLDLRPGGPGAGLGVLVGTLLTLVAVGVVGRPARGAPVSG